MVQTGHKAHIIKTRDAEQLAATAHDIFVEAAQSATARGQFMTAISGGHTPAGFFEQLGSSQTSRELDWDKIHVFWVDERCVSPESEDSNYRMAAETFLRKIDIPEKNVHRIRAEGPDYKSVAKIYEKELREAFGSGPGEIPQFDLIVLGMGADGHTGSLFPNSFAPFETTDLAMVVYQMSGGTNRITITNPVLLNAAKLMVLVAGAEKAQTLRHVMISEPDVITYPIHALWPVLDRIIWVADADAASLLPEDSPEIEIEKR